MQGVDVIVILFGGLIAGILNVIVGGGTLISVPVLITAGLPAHLAIGTNRFAMIFNTGVGAIGYYRKVSYGIKLALLFAAFASAGSFVGANIVLQIGERLLNYVIGVFMLIMGAIIVYKKELGLKEKRVVLKNESYIFIAVLSFFLGIYGGFFGAGISAMFMFVFTSFLGTSFIRSAGITRFIVAILSIISTLVFLAAGQIDFPRGMVLVVAFVAGAKIGVELAMKVGNTWIRRLFIFLVIISSIKLLFL